MQELTKAPVATKRTTVEMDVDLLARASKSLGGNPTIKEVVHEGLRRIASEAALQEYVKALNDLSEEERQALYNVRDTAW